jgi:arylsulfatase A-like enzyme
VHWPAGMAAERRGKIETQPGLVVDIMTTCVDLAGAKYPAEVNADKIKPMEGVSLKPTFDGGVVKRLSPMFWEHESNRAVREGKWKLVAKADAPWELYDMEQDRTELHDLASTETEKVKELVAKWDAWAARANVLPLGGWKGKAAGD